MHPSMEIDIREHAFLAVSSSIGYSFYRIKGLTNILHGGNGMYMDRFITQGAPGLLLLHGNGNVFERTLAAGEKLIVEPGAFLFKDASVTMNTVQLPVKTGLLRRGCTWPRWSDPAGSASSRCTCTTGATDVEPAPAHARPAECPLHLPLLPDGRRRDRHLLPALRRPRRHPRQR